MRWRVVLLAAAMIAVLAVAGGAALAAAIDGTRGDDRLRGTNARDQRTGHAGDDVLWGRGSADNLDGDGGRDTIYTGPKGESAKDVVDAGDGNDRVYAFNRPASRDIVNCGRGFDRVTADARDVLEGCNRVSRP